jgi:glycosyltransferase involved in cell wall biosynthesis
MTEPLVVAIMLTRDRPQMAARAVASFRAQTYANKRLFIFDTSADAPQPIHSQSVERHWAPFRREWSIGKLRNEGNQYAASWTGVTQGSVAEIFVHWDDDDVSHPNRIAEQVALLQASGADCVGYRDMLFWRQRANQLPDPARPTQTFEVDDSQAWLFTGDSAFPNYALGTSLCYWRRIWERKPFPDLSQGVEEKWCDGLKALSVSSFPGLTDELLTLPENKPRMIASIHGANTSRGYDIEGYVAMGSKQWRRVPEWDDYARERMEL